MNICTRILSGFILLGVFTSTLYARPNELFISEYIEGSSNNKALEIFNGTGTDVSLNGYTISTSFNGGTLVKNISLTGVLSHGDVHVLAHQKADPSILAEADQLVPVTWFNGDDAVSLMKNSIAIDVFGLVGVDPGTQWGTGIYATKDHTLRRKPDVSTGKDSGDDTFLPSIEWDGFSKDDFSGLGSHSITNINIPPVITGSPDISVDQGQVYHFLPSAFDGDGDLVKFSIENKPAWATFDTASGQFSGQPENQDVGVYGGIKISVTDEFGGANSLDVFTITVIDINDAPVINGAPVTSIIQGELYSFTPISSDPDSDELFYSVSNMPAWLNFDSQTGAISGIPGNNDVGVYSELKIVVSDGRGGFDSLDPFVITVININDFPTISGDPKNSVKQGSQYQFLPLSIDVDGDALNFSIANKPLWAKFKSSTGELYGVPKNKHIGVYENIIIAVSDGLGGEALLPPFSITVTNINDSPIFTGKLPAEEIYAGDQFGFTPDIYDPDGDQLSFIINNIPAWVKFDTATGSLYGVPSNSDRGVYEGISIIASDSSDASVTIGPLRILVFDQNRAPEFEIGENQVISKNAGRQMISGWAKNISDGDFETQQLHFEIVENTNPDLFNGLFIAQPDISASTGTLYFSTAYNAEGSATLTIVLKDNGGVAHGGSDISEPQQFTITVDSNEDLGAGELFNPDVFTFNEVAAVASNIGELTNLSLALAFSSLDEVNNAWKGLGDFDYSPPLDGLNSIDRVVLDLAAPQRLNIDSARAPVIINAHISNHGEVAAENVKLHLLVHGSSEILEYDYRCVPGDTDVQISCQLGTDFGSDTTLQFSVSVKETTGLLAEGEVVASNDGEFRDNDAVLHFESPREPIAESTTQGGGGLGLWILMWMYFVKSRKLRNLVA